ncbi:hypothetical protein HN388_02820 [bacterium]|nr:hypothetical protein [bacterium]MBT4291141.1 hypothetical protein [bacterium]MBT7311870.1 hypothetical protein [bacterium]
MDQKQCALNMDANCNTVDNQQFIKSIADKIVGSSFEGPAIFMLSIISPFSFVIGQAVIFTTPLLNFMIPENILRESRNLFNDRDGVEKLIAQIELQEQR